jgi:hypothetical protein
MILKDFVLENYPTAECRPLAELYPEAASLNPKEFKNWFYILGFGMTSIAKKEENCWAKAAKAIHRKMLRKFES